MIFPVLKYGNSVLETPAQRVEKFDAEIESLVQDMFESMYAANGVGLAAPQIGRSVRLAVVDVTVGKNPEAKIVLINPEIIRIEGEQREEEGCLSLQVFQSTRDPRLFYIHSRWTSEAAFEHHAELPHTVRFLERVQPLIDHPLDVTRARGLE